jgi:hypothetical protein
MKKAMTKPAAAPDDEIHAEYDFSNGVRGKYAKRYPKDCVMVVLDPDVAKIFPDGKSVNNALRAISGILKRAKKSA